MNSSQLMSGIPTLGFGIFILAGLLFFCFWRIFSALFP